MIDAQTFVILLIVVIPFVAVLDYFWLRGRYKKYHGVDPKPYYWVAPCAIEVGCFVAGYMIGVSA